MMFDPIKYLDGIPTDVSISNEEVCWLYKLGSTLPYGAVILELGLNHGRSACLLTYIAVVRKGRYVGVDHFKGAEGMKEVGSKQEVETYLSERGLGDFALVIEQPTEEVEWRDPVDMLFIDASHFEPSVSNDVQKYVPFVKVGGIAAFDDYADWTQVGTAADRMCDNEHWKDLGLVDDMKCWRRIL
jgi:predicted O-methyltransferase YrrM